MLDIILDIRLVQACQYNRYMDCLNTTVKYEIYTRTKYPVISIYRYNHDSPTSYTVLTKFQSVSCNTGNLFIKGVYKCTNTFMNFVRMIAQGIYDIYGNKC